MFDIYIYIIVILHYIFIYIYMSNHIKTQSSKFLCNQSIESVLSIVAGHRRYPRSKGNFGELQSSQLWSEIPVTSTENTPFMERTIP